jgi:DNA-binding beta-propeller fold protein YncE
VVTTLAGRASMGSSNGIGTNAYFNFLVKIQISPDGLFALIPDNGNHIIRHVVLSTSVVTTLAGSGTAGSVDGVGTNARFNSPLGIAISPNGTTVLVTQLIIILIPLVNSAIQRKTKCSI